MNAIDERILKVIDLRKIQSTIAMLQRNQLGDIFDLAYDHEYGEEFRDLKDDDCSSDYFTNSKVFVSELSPHQCLKMIDFILSSERIYPQFTDQCIYDGTFLHILFRLRDLKVKYDYQNKAQ